MPKSIETVPNQRVLTIHKEPTDKQHKYTLNNLEAMGEAARRLQSKAGFKLYMYLAKNQPTEVTKREWVLSSADFCNWSGAGIAAYRTAFKELEEEGYLIPKDKTKDKESIYTFFDKSQKEDIKSAHDNVIIEIPIEKVEEVQQLQEQVAAGFVF